MLLYGTIVLTAERTRTPLSSRLPCHPETGRQAQMFTLSSSPTRDSSVQRSALPLSASPSQHTVSVSLSQHTASVSPSQRLPLSTRPASPSLSVSLSQHTASIAGSRAVPERGIPRAPRTHRLQTRRYSTHTHTAGTHTGCWVANAEVAGSDTKELL